MYTTQIERGIVRKRVVFVPRSVEIRPLFSELIVAEQAGDVLGLILGATLDFSYSLQPCSRVGMEGAWRLWDSDFKKVLLWGGWVRRESCCPTCTDEVPTVEP